LTETPSEKAEAAAIRKRWLTLGEIVAIAGLIISAIAFWNSWDQRRNDESERRQEKAVETRVKTAVLLRGTPQRNGAVLLLTDPDHPVQRVTITFPSAFGLSPQTSSVDPQIEAEWLRAKLLSIAEKSDDERRGSIPVMIASNYWQGDELIVDRAIYDLAWRIRGRFLQGRIVQLRGLALRERGKPSQARLDAMWTKT